MKTFLGLLPLLALSSLCLGALAAPASAQSPRYRFKVMLDSAAGTYTALDKPVIDARGRIAARVVGPGRNEIVRTDGTYTELVADTAGPIADFKWPHVMMQMNATGSVAFCATLDSGGEAIYAWDGATLREVMRSNAMPWPSSAPGVFFYDLSLNASGSVACWARGPAEAAFLNDGTSTHLVTQDYRSVDGTDWFMVGHLRLLDDNSLVMLARRDDFPGIVRAGLLQMSAAGGVLNVLATGTTPETLLEHASYDWSVNNSAQAIYSGGPAQGLGGLITLVLAPQSGPIVIATNQGTSPWDAFGGINVSHSGKIAFAGLVSGGWILADGPDAVRNRVLGPGDALAGRVVQGILIPGRDAINEFGQICLGVLFTNGSKAIVRADPRRWASR